MSSSNSGSKVSYTVHLMGTTIAVCMSWVFNHSVVWCILHGFLGWLYVAYKTIWYVVTNY